MRSVRPAIKKIRSAVVRAYCQEELSATTKSTVSASRLRVIRFAQFISSSCLLAGLARRNLGEGGPFPNRHFLLQLIHDPSTGSESFAAVRTCHSQKKRWFPYGDKSDSVMNDHKLKSKFLRSLLGNLSQLMVGHFPMGFIFNSFDFVSFLKSYYISTKIVY